MIEVHELTPEEWPAWRELRLAALAEAPQAFGSTLAEWTGAGDTEPRWRARLEAAALNLVVRLDGTPVGMASAVGPGPDGVVEIISMWVAPSGRGTGVSDAVLDHLLAWAERATPAAALELSVKVDNAPAIALYQRHGFADAGPAPDDQSERLMRRAVARSRN